MAKEEEKKVLPTPKPTISSLSQAAERQMANKEKKEEPAPVKEKESDDDIIARALIGIAPALLGAAIGGDVGGSVGAKAGMAGLQDIGEQEKEKKEERALAAAGEQKRLEKQDERSFQKQMLAQKQANDKELEMIKQESRRQLLAMGSKAQPKPTERQAATFAKRLEQAEGVFENLAASGTDPTSAKFAGQRYLPEMFKPENVKMQEQAERNFVNAVLRRESGAAISASEFDSAEKQYFPRIGDTPAVLRQKEINRKIAMQGLVAEAGGRAIGDIDLNQITASSTIPEQGMGLNLGVQSAQAADPLLAADPTNMTDEQLDQMLMQLKQRAE